MDIEHNFQDRLNRTEVELSALKEKVSFFNVIYGKFDVTLEKIQEMVEDRRYENNEELKVVYQRLQESEQRIMQELKVVRDEMKQMHEHHNKQITELNKWRWMMMGVAAAVGGVAAKVLSVGMNLG